jgi:hypothetical protein
MKQLSLCQNCSSPIEFEENRIGESVTCSNCGQATQLGLTKTAEDEDFDPHVRFCLSCGSIGAWAQGPSRGNPVIELLLWVCFLLPGLLYSLWRHTNLPQVCETCGSQELIPPDSPRAIYLRRRMAQGK